MTMRRAEPDFTLVECEFRGVLVARGIVPPPRLISDGRLHRCDAEGRNGKNDAAYVLYLDDFPAGGFENWRDGLGWENWHADVGRELTQAERAALRRRAEADREQRDADEARRRAEAAANAARIWNEAEPAVAHPYLIRKGVQAHGVRVSCGNLVVPVRDAAMLHSLQFIDPDGAKMFLSGGRVKGCYFAIGEPGVVILIAEGFATGASVHQATGHAVAVAFNAGNLKSVAEALRSQFPTARIVVCADDDHLRIDNPGINKAQEAAAAVGGVVALPEFGSNRTPDENDFNDMARLGADAVRERIEMALNQQDPKEERAASPHDVREFPVLAEEAFIGLPGDIVRRIEPHTESDRAGLLLSALAFFGNCLGRGPHYRVESTDHGTNIYVVKVGDSSKARKGTGEDRVLSIFRQVDDEWARDRVHTGLSSGEGVIWAVRDRITKIAKDRKTGAIIEEVTDDGVYDKRLMVIESEFAGVLRVMQREGNILSRVLRDGWDRGNLATLTKNSPAKATGSLVSLSGHITATEFRANLDRTEMANGFGNRFLIACVRRSKFLPFGGDLPDEDVAAMASEVRRAVAHARAIGRVTMSPAAADGWGKIYCDLSADRPGLLGSLTARAEAQTVRLATLYALWAGSDRIQLEHLTAATAVWDFCFKSVEYIFGDALGDPIVDTILTALRGAGSQGLTRTEINNLFSRHVSANQIARSLGQLASAGLAGQRKGDAAGGRPPEIWVAKWGA